MKLTPTIRIMLVLASPVLALCVMVDSLLIFWITALTGRKPENWREP